MRKIQQKGLEHLEPFSGKELFVYLASQIRLIEQGITRNIGATFRSKSIEEDTAVGEVIVESTHF